MSNWQREYQENFYAQDTAQIDAFNRSRVSDSFTLFDSKQLSDNAPLFWDDAVLSGSGTSSTHSANTASTTLAVSNVTAGSRARQTFRWFNYQPSKSQLILMSFVMGAGGIGITKRVGYFNTSNGLYLQQTSTGLAFVIRSNVTGTPVNTVVNQASWNLDKMDGTGRSGITLDVTKSQILVIDFEWLGVGRVRWGFVINGLIVYTHQSLNANVGSGVYMSTPNLPLRYEITNDGTGGANSLVHICASVISEGGQDAGGIIRSVNTGSTAATYTTVGTVYAVIGLRLKATHLGATIDPQFASFLSNTASDPFLWTLYSDPTVTGTFTYNALANSAVEFALGTGTPTLSGGTVISSGYGQALRDVFQPLTSLIRLGSSIAGTPTTLVLGVTPVGASLGLNASLTWRELL